MDSSEKKEKTPRRSTRLQKLREQTPEPPKPAVLGPRAMMKLNKSKQNLEQSTSEDEPPKTPKIFITAPSPRNSQKGRERKMRASEEVEKSSTQVLVESGGAGEPSPKKDCLMKEKCDEIDTVQQKQEATSEKRAEEVEQPPAIIRQESTIKEDDDTNASGEVTVIDRAVSMQIVDKLDTTPQLMDESIISVPETPPLTTPVVKDATFSPEVDTSLHDSRPHIDSVDSAILNTTPVHRHKPIRTSTPLAQKLFKRETPKITAPVLSALAKILSPKVREEGKMTEESLSDTLNGQFKMGNPLEKSILKSSRRKRSLSVADGESFMQKKVVFVSPEVMDIDSIDVKMMQSFREEKENSILKQNMASGGAKRHNRSLSVSDTPGAATTKSRMPDFQAIHARQFKRMESIVDHVQRKANRAPSKSTLPTVPEKAAATLKHNSNKKTTSDLTSKIPTFINRKPLAKIPSRDNTINFNAPSAKSSSAPSQVSTSQAMRKKVEERRERNTSLYKGKTVRAGHDHRKKAETIIKGVRLNRRFELQMQHRFGENSDE